MSAQIKYPQKCESSGTGPCNRCNVCISLAVTTARPASMAATTTTQSDLEQTRQPQAEALPGGTVNPGGHDHPCDGGPIEEPLPGIQGPDCCQDQAIGHAKLNQVLDSEAICLCRHDRRLCAPSPSLPSVATVPRQAKKNATLFGVAFFGVSDGAARYGSRRGPGCFIGHRHKSIRYARFRHKLFSAWFESGQPSRFQRPKPIHLSHGGF